MNTTPGEMSKASEEFSKAPVEMSRAPEGVSITPGEMNQNQAFDVYGIGHSFTQTFANSNMSNSTNLTNP